MRDKLPKLGEQMKISLVHAVLVPAFVAWTRDLMSTIVEAVCRSLEILAATDASGDFPRGMGWMMYRQHRFPRLSPLQTA